MKTKALSVIRILGRDQVGSDPLFTKQVTTEKKIMHNNTFSNKKRTKLGNDGVY